MRTKSTFLAIIAMLLLSTTAFAESIQNYLCDFNREIIISGTKTYNGNEETSAYSNNAASAFKPGPGWGKTVISKYSSGWYSYYEAWAWRSTGGVDGSGYLTGRTSSYDIKDYLITPVVSGNVSLYAKLYGSGGTEYVKVYACTEEANGTFTIGSEIEMNNATDVTATAWTQISTTVAEPTRLAIRVRNAGVDNFAADLAEVEYEKAMKLTVSNKSTDTPDCNAEGFFQVSCDVTVTNTGEIALTPGTEGYEAFIQESTSTALVGTDKWGVTPITETLEIGETSQVYHLVANIPYVGHEGRKRYDAVEGLSLTHEMATSSWVEPVVYEPLFTFSPESANTVLDNGLNVSFGKISADQTVTYRVRNRGAAPLHVNSITVPEGFSINVAGEFDVPAHGEQNVVITASAATPGIFSGAMTITYSNTETFTVNLSSVILDNSKFYWTFDNQKWPSGTLVTNTNWSVTSDSYHGYSDYYAQNSNYSDPTFFFTPLMHAEAGDQFAFDVAKRSANSSLKVYVTTDRNNPGTAVKEIAASEMSSTTVGSNSSYAFSTFTITIPEAGDYYIGFEGGYVLVNDLYGLTPVAVEHDVVLTNAVLPAEATVNKASEASVKVLNTLATAETGYTLAYHIGTQTFKAETVDLAQNDAKTIKFAFTPHEAGEFDSWIDITLANGDVIASAHQTVTVTGEVASSEVQVGNNNQTSTSVPVKDNYGNTETEIVYKADWINLSANTKITKLTFKGYKTYDSKDGNLLVYIQNTSDTDPKFTDTASKDAALESMTKIYDGVYTMQKAGTSSDHASLISIDIPEGFNYTGENLRVFVSWYSVGGYNNNRMSWEASTPGSYPAKFRYNDNALTSTFTQTNQLPTLYLGIEKDPSTLSGKVTVLNADNTVDVVAGAKVTAAAGDVEYYATTDAEGNYSMVIMQDKLTYTLSASYNAKNLFPQEDVVEMNGASQVYDIQYEEGVDFYVNAVDMAAEATVNNAYTANITLTNYNQTALAAADYTVQLVVDDQVVAEKSVDAAPMTAVTIPLSFVPHADGTVNAHIFVDAPTRDKTTADVAVTIKKELAEQEVTVLSKTGYDNQPIYTNYNHSMSETVYTAEKLGLKPGAKITSLSFLSYRTSAPVETRVRLWIENTEDGIDFTAGRDVAEMRLVSDETYSIQQHGAYNSDEKYFTYDLSENPFVYTGGNIRIVMAHDANTWKSMSFAVDANYKGSVLKNDDNKVAEEIAWNATKKSSPVLVLGVDNSKSYTGTVKYANETPAAGAEITLTSGDVIYSGVAEADGTFDIAVVQHSLEYNAVVTDGEYTYNANVNLDVDDSAVEIYLMDGVMLAINPTVGYATFFDSTHPVKVPAGAQAYIFTQLMSMATPGIVEYSEFAEACGEEFDGVIPANEPVVIKGEGNVALEYADAPSFDSFAEYGANFLWGTDEAIITPVPLWAEDMYEADEFYYYALSLNKAGDAGSAGFYWMNATGAPFMNGAHKAYLAIPMAMFPAEAKMSFRFDEDVTTGIKNVNVNNDNYVYNLQGQRVGANQKGIVIVNGRKYVRK